MKKKKQVDSPNRKALVEVYKDDQSIGRVVVETQRVPIVPNDDSLSFLPVAIWDAEGLPPNVIEQEKAWDPREGFVYYDVAKVN